VLAARAVFCSLAQRRKVFGTRSDTELAATGSYHKNKKALPDIAGSAFLQVHGLEALNLFA